MCGYIRNVKGVKTGKKESDGSKDRDGGYLFATVNDCIFFSNTKKFKDYNLQPCKKEETNKDFIVSHSFFFLLLGKYKTKFKDTVTLYLQADHSVLIWLGSIFISLLSRNNLFFDQINF